MTEPILKSKEISLNLGTEKMSKLIRIYASAAMFGVLATVINQMVDEMFLGRLSENSSLAVAGLGVINPLIYLCTGLGSAIGVSATAIVGIAFGEKQYIHAKRTIGNLLPLSVFFTAFITLLLVFGGDKLMFTLGASEDTLRFANAYMGTYIFGIFFCVLANALMYTMNAVGRPRLRMVGIFIQTGVNLILDPILIFGLGMGMSGAALSNIISMALSTVWYIVWILKTLLPTGFSASFLLPNIKVIGKILLFSLGTFAAIFTEAIMNAVFTRTAVKFGDDCVALTTTFALLLQMVVLFMAGFANAVEAISGYNYGERKMDRTRTVLKVTAIACVIMAFIFEIVMLIFPRLCTGIILTESDVVNMSAPFMRLYAFGIVGLGLITTVQVIFPSLKTVAPAFAIVMVRKIVLIIPLLLILPGIMGIEGVFLAEGIGDLMGGLVALFLILWQFKRLKRIGKLEKTA
jgi:putative MATE family efflux protein